MKKVAPLTASLAVVVALGISGCGSSQTYTGANGEKVTVSNNGSNATVTGPNGEKATVTTDANGQTHYEGSDSKGNKVTEDINGGNVSIKDSKGNSYQTGAGSVTEADLGVPFYPNSVSSTGMSGKTNDNDKTTVMCSRSTKDAPSKVVDFYKDKVQDGKPSSMTSGGTSVAGLDGKLSDGSEIHIAATQTGGEDTQIMIAVSKKK